MKITQLEISNFRGIKYAKLENLQSLVVIAGQNGVGKSCIFEAIKFFKSVFSEQQQNEIQNFFGEYQINHGNTISNIYKLFNDANKPFSVGLHVKLSNEEINYLIYNLENIFEIYYANKMIPGCFNINGNFNINHLGQFQSKLNQIQYTIKTNKPNFLEALDRNNLGASIILQPWQINNANFQFDCPNEFVFQLLQVIFSFILDNNIGIIDFHGPNRSYLREEIQHVNVNFNLAEQSKQSYTQHALYNYSNKYTNIKSELANAYLKEILAKALNKSSKKDNKLTENLQDLFATFFPNKAFTGPEFDEKIILRFPVSINGEKKHDLNELSSGEKEILFGYLRLRDSAPKHSVILLDEPELHLNPKLTSKIPDFYSRSLVKDQGHQIWLITHSDALIKGCAGLNNTSIFHFLSYMDAKNSVNQAVKISPDSEFETKIYDLLGDIAGYNPQKDIIIVEGENSKYDENILKNLFPEFCSNYNIFSAGNKKNVLKTVNSLRTLKSQIIVNNIKIFTITDMDFDTNQTNGEFDLNWDVYHIENYFLEEELICEILNEYKGPHEEKIIQSFVTKSLTICAEKVKGTILQERISNFTNQILIGCIDTKIDPKSDNLIENILKRITDSMKKINENIDPNRIEETLKLKLNEWNKQLSDDIKSGNWKKTFPGRKVLSEFVNNHKDLKNYNSFVSRIYNKMSNNKITPDGMKSVLEKIESFSKERN